MEEKLSEYYEALKALRRSVERVEGSRINRRAIREEAERLGTLWFKEIASIVKEHVTLGDDVFNAYADASRRLVKVSSPNNLKSSYLESVDKIVKTFKKEVILPIKTADAPTPVQSAFTDFIENITDALEGEYFQEAIDCAKAGYLRGASVLAWCAAVDRIHRKIDELGFTKFNVAAAQMASQQKGRYKRFNQSYSIASLSELREVFDTSVLWVIDGMGLIDSNQHTRLRSCFDMRNHAAHPGDAPITPFNLMSMFSDIVEIVLKNPRFQVVSRRSEE